jgi:prolyl-tRNA editing enzyme YbaK/EbsC (Cys-tRNA(Pro) deacylase)
MRNPSFGRTPKPRNLYEEKIKTLKQAAFNCGLQTESIIMQANDLIKLVQPKFAAFSK